LTVAVEEDEAFDGGACVTAEFAVFQFDRGALAERERF
jgi:phytoene dehydrogenase-like protein